MNDVDELLQLIVGFRFADETFRKLLKRILLAKVRREEQHQTQATVDFTTGLECGILLRASFAFLDIGIVCTIAIDFHGSDGGTVVSRGFVGRHELRGRIQATIERVNGFLRTDDGRAWMGQHEHGQVIGISIGDIQMLAINIHRGRETTLVDNFDQFVGNGLGSQSRSDGVKTKSRNRRLRNTRRGTRRMLRLMCRSRGNRHGTSQVVGGSQNRQILIPEQQTNARLVTKLQTVGREVLPLRLG